MKSYAILQSNLLDIIFENRNKDYGAYLLRKNYNKRLTTSVFISITTFILLALLFTIFFKPSPEREIKYPKVPDGIKLTKYIPVLINNTPRLNIATPVKKIVLPVNAPPVIVADEKINKPVATDQIELPSNIQTTASGVSFSSAVLGAENPGGSGGLQKLTVAGVIKKDRSVPVETADIMPQYPGGIKALLAFLKNNIHAPADVDQGEVVTVKIKFVINYDGRIESFGVMESGGEIFDNEVIRVLKKMPLWIPGKSKGENVSVFYNLPVKFTSGL
ncbi:MAG: energy transducer TonB [Ginsengibacter sp.]